MCCQLAAFTATRVPSKRKKLFWNEGDHHKLKITRSVAAQDPRAAFETLWSSAGRLFLSLLKLLNSDYLGRHRNYCPANKSNTTEQCSLTISFLLRTTPLSPQCCMFYSTCKSSSFSSPIGKKKKPTRYPPFKTQHTNVVFSQKGFIIWQAKKKEPVETRIP